jgi:hypothetical protein
MRNAKQAVVVRNVPSPRARFAGVAWLVGVAAGGLLLGSCVEEQILFNVALQVRVAQGLDPLIVLTNNKADETDPLGMAFNWVPDFGPPDGGDPRGDVTFKFDAAATSASFELIAFLDGKLAARGTTPVLALPTEPGADLPVPLLLAPVGRVDALDALPPDIGADACFAADQLGRVFVVGGSDSNQTGYVLGADFAVVTLSGVAFARTAAPGCVAADGHVVAVGGTGGIISQLHELDAGSDVVVDIAIPGAEAAGAFGAKSLDDYWLFASNRVELLRANGVSFGFAGGVNVVDVEVLPDGNALVLTEANTMFLYDRDDLDSPVNLGQAKAIGRRFDDVMAISDDDALLLIDGTAAVVLRGAVGTGVVTAFTVLSDDSVVAIEGDELKVYGDGDTVDFSTSLPRARTHISAIPGDTVILAGGDGTGLDAFALRPPE